jgi:hypothetical protein
MAIKNPNVLLKPKCVIFLAWPAQIARPCPLESYY